MCREGSAMDDGKAFRLKDGCVFVGGVTCGAIYDLNQGKVYSLNETGRQIVEGIVRDPVLSDRVCQQIEYLTQLADLGLGEFVMGAEPSSEPAAISPKPHQGLDYLWLELTQGCNLRCLHCYASCSNVEKRGDGLTLGQWESILRQGAELGCQHVQLIGGEPLLFRDFEKLVMVACEHGYSVEVFTNATLLSEERARLFAGHGIQVRVSLYGGTAEVHDAITQVRGSFQRTCDALELLRDYDIGTTVAVIVMKQNQRDLQSIAECIRSLGHEYEGYDVVRPSGRGNDAELVPTDSSVLSGRIMDHPNFSTDRDSFHAYHHWNNCWSGKLAITSNGDALPCIFAREVVCGNIKTHTIAQLASEGSLVDAWAITKDRIDVCRDCEYRYACTDCRPLAASESHDLYAKYPRCTYDPGSGQWRNPE